MQMTYLDFLGVTFFRMRIDEAKPGPAVAAMRSTISAFQIDEERGDRLRPDVREMLDHVAQTQARLARPESTTALVPVK